MYEDLGRQPPPPPRPKYDPNEEAPKWNYSRLRWNLPADKGSKPWTPIGTQPKTPDDPDWRGVVRNNVIELPMPGPYEYGQPNSLKYFWFDTPDYADPFKKLGYSAKWFSITGFTLLCVKGSMEGIKCTFENNVRLTKLILAPWFLAGMAASLTVITLANLRGKVDDKYNYAAAGFVMGSIIGRKNHAAWFKATVPSVVAAITVKHNAEINGHLFPVPNLRAAGRALKGLDAEHGIWSGDFRFGFRGTNGEPGRDLRRPY